KYDHKLSKPVTPITIPQTPPKFYLGWRFDKFRKTARPCVALLCSTGPSYRNPSSAPSWYVRPLSKLPDGISYSHAAGSFDSHDIFIARPEPNRRSSRRPLKEQRLRRPNDRNEEQANADTDTFIRTVLNAVIGDTA
ncbi:hypothetical protein, partial [Alistipes ihumii]|uniref:hypothetical protein n=3 Tax=Alistipes ihumii TaxID=1470347 RepID=UPI003AB20662